MPKQTKRPLEIFLLGTFRCAAATQSPQYSGEHAAACDRDFLLITVLRDAIQDHLMKFGLAHGKKLKPEVNKTEKRVFISGP